MTIAVLVILAYCHRSCFPHYKLIFILFLLSFFYFRCGQHPNLQNNENLESSSTTQVTKILSDH